MDNNKVGTLQLELCLYIETLDITFSHDPDQ